MSNRVSSQSCKVCDHKKNAPDDICNIKKAADGFDIRCVGSWAKHKNYYLARYMDIFSTGMKNKWGGNLYYIDLFAGCGKCRVRDTEEEIEGSALSALNVKYPFKKYFFVDINPRALKALHERVRNTALLDRSSLIEGDCNEKVGGIVNEIPSRGALSLCVIDPTGLQIRFQTIEQLTKHRRVDLIITFPEGMAIKRNLDRFLDQDHSLLDDFMGDKAWRQVYRKDKLAQLTESDREKRFIEIYKKRLKNLGYKKIESVDVLIKSTEKNLPLYYLLYASKHTLGYELWKRIGEIGPTGQRRLKLNNPGIHVGNRFAANIRTARAPKVHYNKYILTNGKKHDLVDRVNDGSIIKRFDKTPIPEKPTDVVCPHFLELKWAYGCPFDCSWCYLKGTFRFRPEGIKPAYKPLEKIKSHVEAFLSQVDTPEILNTGEIADSLMKEGKTSPFSKFIIPVFQKQRVHKVLFLTKSSNVRNLLDIAEKSQVVMSFSVNAKPVARRWEKKAPPVSKRLEAARKLHEAGYEVRIRIDPIVPVENWEKHYIDLVDEMFSKFRPTRITLGSLRGLQSTINGTKDHSWVHFLTEKSNWGKKIDFTTRYKVYKAVVEHLKNNLNYSEVALCKETMAMWDKLGMNWQSIRCNCTW